MRSPSAKCYIYIYGKESYDACGPSYGSVSEAKFNGKWFLVVIEGNFIVFA